MKSIAIVFIFRFMFMLSICPLLSGVYSAVEFAITRPSWLLGFLIAPLRRRLGVARRPTLLLLLLLWKTGSLEEAAVTPFRDLEFRR